ncbi:MAG: hypothetical protein ACMXYF_01545 [Candidatus Woesearchaeota archaeon]
MPKKKKLTKKKIPTLQYGVIHSQHGLADGVSIVMGQIEDVMQKYMKVDPKNIHYLTGKSGKKTRQVHENELIWHKHTANRYVNTHYQKGLSQKKHEYIEKQIQKTQKVIERFIEKHAIDVLIVHNSCHPVNFCYAVALSRYYEQQKAEKKKTPKYILWWHDSFLERERYKNPHPLIEQYLYEGVPGKHVDYVLFINSLQFKGAQEYFHSIEQKHPDFFPLIDLNHDVIYNTTDLYIKSFEDLQESKNVDLVNSFLEQFHVLETLKKDHVSFEKTVFCLQHTRVVQRKRIDFALEYCFSFLYMLKKRKIAQALYFLISGNSGDEFDKTRHDLEKLHKQLSKKYGIDTFYLVFAEDFDKQEIPFEEYPRIFAKLNGFSTYFSEIEGFGNNLLEVMASGLIPVAYTYPVFLSDIKKYNFKIIALDHFVIDLDSQLQLLEVLQNQRKRKIWVQKNLKILEKKLNHRMIKQKLTRAIIRNTEDESLNGK